MYTFSTETVAEFYGRKFFSIQNSSGELVAYSEKVFDITEQTTFYRGSKTLIFKDAKIIGGVIWGGEIRGGVICGGEIRGGVIWGGEIWGGEIWGGEIRGGEIWGGEIWGGEIWGGEIWGGVIRGGVIRGGVIRGGVIRGGVIRGGEICGGVIRGGEIRGGEIWGGEIEKTPLQIQGSKHYCVYTKTADGITDAISIGCQTRPISEWLTDFVAIGTENEYSIDEINEYSEYIQMFARRYAPELLSSASA